MATQLQPSTRQQLDELDALLQKMLDQPGKPVEPSSRPGYATQGGGNEPPAAPQFPSANVAFGMPPAVAFTAQTPSQHPDPHKSNLSNWNIDLNPRAGSSVLGERSPLAEKLAPFMDAANAETPAFLQVTPLQSHRFDAIPLDEKSHQSAESYGGLTAIPLVRDILGYSGLAMLAASATWAVLLWSGWF